MSTLKNTRQYVLCFDDNAGRGQTVPPSTPTATPPADPPTGKLFTQEDLNKILAEDKRKHQERQAQLEASYQELLQSQALTQEQRDSLEQKLEDVKKAQLSEKQRIEYDRKQAEEAHANELKKTKEKADYWEKLFKTETVHRSLSDAAASAGVFNPSHIVALLSPDTQLKDVDGKLIPMVDFADIDEKTGEEIRTLRTPMEAVKRMQELPLIHGNLFKSNVVSGVGASQVTGSGTGDIDYTTMDAETYRKNRDAIKRRLSQ